MAKVSIYFRNEKDGFELLNLSYDPDVYVKSSQRELIKLGCSYQIFGNSFFDKTIDRFLSNELIREVGIDLTGECTYFYVIRREED